MSTRGKTRSKVDVQPEPEPKPDDDGDMSVSMIFFRKIFNTNASTPDEMTQHVQAYLNSGAEDLKVDQIGDDDNVTVGNPEGLDFLEETTSDIERCNEERTSMKDAIAQLKKDVTA